MVPPRKPKCKHNTGSCEYAILDCHHIFGFYKAFYIQNQYYFIIKRCTSEKTSNKRQLMCIKYVINSQNNEKIIVFKQTFFTCDENNVHESIEKTETMAIHHLKLEKEIESRPNSLRK